MDSNDIHKAKEDIYDIVGGDGRWQRQIFVLVLLAMVSLAGHNMCMTFFAPNIEHWCAKPPELNMTVSQWKRLALPESDASCYRYNVISSFPYLSHIPRPQGEIVPCDKWEYDESAFGSTVLSKWNLVCDRSWFVSLSKSIFVSGYLVSVTISGYLSDKFGRRKVILMCNFICIISAIISSLSVSFLMFAICRFFIAMGVSGSFSTSFVLLVEIIGTRYRSIYGVGVNFGWCFGFMMLPGIVWLIRDWVLVELIITIPAVIILLCYWLLPDSPRWLIGKGDVEAARILLLKVAATNRSKTEDLDCKLKKLLEKLSKEQVAENKNASILQLFSTPGLLKNTQIIFYLWFVIAFVYYGLTFNTNELAGDPYVNFVLSGAVEIPAYILSLSVIHKFGRKYPQAISMIVAGISGLLFYFVPEDVWWLSTLVSMVGKFCISCSFAIVYVYTAEIFPTVIRNVSLGSSSLCGRFGSIIAPFVRELGNATHPVVPQLMFGALALVGGILVFFLPETHKTNVPDTIKEAAECSRVKSPQNCSVMLKDFKEKNDIY